MGWGGFGGLEFVEVTLVQDRESTKGPARRRDEGIAKHKSASEGAPGTGGSAKS